MNGTVRGNAVKLVTYLMGQDKDLIWDLKPHKEKRTLTQNGYYWKLLDLTAEALKMSKSELHNRMLREYGQKKYKNGSLVTTYFPDSKDMEEVLLEDTNDHYLPTSQILYSKNGIQVRTYIELRGSRTYNTKEMATLLDGMIQEAQQQGIETLTPHELEEMRANEAKHNRRNMETDKRL